MKVSPEDVAKVSSAHRRIIEALAETFEFSEEREFPLIMNTIAISIAALSKTFNIDKIDLFLEDICRITKSFLEQNIQQQQMIYKNKKKVGESDIYKC